MPIALLKSLRNSTLKKERKPKLMSRPLLFSKMEIALKKLQK